MHSSCFYTAAAIAFPWVLVAAGRSSALRWPVSAVVSVYMAAKLLVIWTLPLFPAEPRLSPILTRVDHMVPPDFPLLVIAPALAMDLVLQRWRGEGRPAWWSDWALAAFLGATFFVLFLVAQWSFSFFLHSDLSTNWFFATENAPYSASPGSYFVRRELFPWNAGPADLRAKLGAGLVISMASARVGLWLGSWMRGVRR